VVLCATGGWSRCVGCGTKQGECCLDSLKLQICRPPACVSDEEGKVMVMMRLTTADWETEIKNHDADSSTGENNDDDGPLLLPMGRASQLMRTFPKKLLCAVYMSSTMAISF